MPWRSPALSLSPKDYWYANHANWAEKRHDSYDPAEAGYVPGAPADYYSQPPPAWGHGGSSYGDPHGSYGGPHGSSYGGSHGSSYGGGRHRVRGGLAWDGEHPRVGLDLQMSKAAARAWIEQTDDDVRDSKYFAWVLALQDEIFKWADELGVGDQVREVVYDIRTLEYMQPVAAPLAAGIAAQAGNPAAGAAAGASALSIVGGVAALGAAAVVVGVADALFGGGSDAEQAAIKAAQAQVLHLRDRLTLAQFATEQDETAQIHMALSILPWRDQAGEKQAAASAQKLAQFYRVTAQRLGADERAAFESISNLSRWEGTLAAYSKMTTPQQDTLNNLFGKSAPRLPYQLKGPIEAEQAKLTAILKKHGDASGGGAAAWTALGLTLAAAAGALAVVRPDLAKKGLGYAKTGARVGARAAASGAKYATKAGAIIAGAVKKVV